MKYTEWVDAFVACCPVPSFRSVFCWDGVAVTFHCSPWSKTTTYPYTARFYRHCKYWCLLPVLERTLFVACLDCFLACTGHSIGVESPYMSVVSHIETLRFLWLILRDILRHIETYWDILRHIETYWDILRHDRKGIEKWLRHETWWDMLRPWSSIAELELWWDHGETMVRPWWPWWDHGETGRAHLEVVIAGRNLTTMA